MRPGYHHGNSIRKSTTFLGVRLNSNSERRGTQRPLAEDLALLQQASDLLTRLYVVDASKVCDGEPARTVGRFSSKKK
jgi:hypothetical protein